MIHKNIYIICTTHILIHIILHYSHYLHNSYHLHNSYRLHNSYGLHNSYVKINFLTPYKKLIKLILKFFSIYRNGKKVSKRQRKASKKSA